MPIFFSVTYPVVLLTYPIKRNVRGRGLLGLQFNALAFVGILEAAGHIASEKEKQIIVNIHSQFLYSPEFHPRGRTPLMLIVVLSTSITRVQKSRIKCPEADLLAGSRPQQVGN